MRKTQNCEQHSTKTYTGSQQVSKYRSNRRISTTISTGQESQINNFRHGRSISKEMSSLMNSILARKKFQSIGIEFLRSVMKKFSLAAVLLRKAQDAPVKVQKASSGTWTVADTRNSSNPSHKEASPRTPLTEKSTCPRSNKVSLICSHLTAQILSQQSWADFQGPQANLSVQMTSASRTFCHHRRIK